MNARELAQIIGFVKNLCPAQKFDEHTPDAWQLVIGTLPFEDARAAVVELGGELQFIAPADVAAKAKSRRLARVKRLPMPRPNDVPGVAEADEIRAIERAIADGVIADLGGVAAYERWGGSLHLAWQRRQVPALEGPAPAGDPKAVENFIAPLANTRSLPPEVASVISRRRPPGSAIKCPVCHAPANRKCRSSTGRELSNTHGTRLDVWATGIVACPWCSAAPGELCTEYGSLYRNGAHRARIEAATAATAQN